MDQKCHFVCLTPTRNESWILRQFLAAAKLWAQRIVVMDQVSIDGSREILRSEPLVDLICNDDPIFDEAHRQSTLLSRARRTVPDKRVLLALDADEFLSANFAGSADWKRITEAPPGTILSFRWVNVQPDFKHAWIPGSRISCGFVDDGSPQTHKRIHSNRVPYPEGAPVLELDDIVVLHLQFVSEDRMKSKHRWYQAWEHLNDPGKSALDIFRQYNHRLGSWKPEEMQLLKPEWLDGFMNHGIDLRSIRSESITWWDRELIEMMEEHGAEKLRKVAIWDRNWSTLAKELGKSGVDFRDPRSLAGKWAHTFLASSQGRRETWPVRLVEKLLRVAGW